MFTTMAEGSSEFEYLKQIFFVKTNLISYAERFKVVIVVYLCRNRLHSSKQTADTKNVKLLQ